MQWKVGCHDVTGVDVDCEWTLESNRKSYFATKHV